MNSFEQEVETELRAMHESWCDRKCDCQGEDEALRLAPRVAAAIQKAQFTTFNLTWTGDWPTDGPTPAEEASIRDDALEAALAALRGETP